MNIGTTVKLLRKSDNGNWFILNNERGNPIKGVIKSLSFSRDNKPIFALVMVKEDEDLYSEELISVDSDRVKLVKY